MYTRSFFRATWILTAMDAGFFTAMNIRPKILRDFLSVIFTVIYLFCPDQAAIKVKRFPTTAQTFRVVGGSA
jgi:hypothetical protein